MYTWKMEEMQYINIRNIYLQIGIMILELVALITQLIYQVRPFCFTLGLPRSERSPKSAEPPSPQSPKSTICVCSETKALHN